MLFFSNNIFILLVFKTALLSKSTIYFFLMFLNKDFTSKFFSLYFIDLLSKFFLIIDADISLLEWFIFSIVDFFKVDIDKLQRLLSIKTILLTCVCESWYAFVKWQSLLPFFLLFLELLIKPKCSCFTLSYLS